VRKSNGAASPMTYEVRHESHPLEWFRHFEPNPRRIERADFVVLCRSVVAFQMVDTLVAAPDGRTLGGNQRLDALIQLAKGFDVPRLDDPSKTEHLQYSPPDGLVHAMVVYGATETQLKAINVALNKHAGTFVDDELSAILREVRETDPGLLGAIDTDDEIERLLREVTPGGGAPNAKGVPSVTLQFSKASAHTRVKQALAAAAKRFKGGEGEKVPSGDLLDQLLSAREGKSRSAEPAEKRKALRGRVGEG